jgi:hypothetical protein
MDKPYSVKRGEFRNNKWLLTNAEWHPCAMGIDMPQFETGVRFRQPCGKFGGFELIEHGWANFEEANNVIIRGLGKGWSCYRIETLMHHIRTRPRFLRCTRTPVTN